MPSEVTTQPQTDGGNQDAGQPANAPAQTQAPSLAPAELARDTGRATTADIPQGISTTPKQEPAGQDRGQQSVPTKGQVPQSKDEQPAKADRAVDAEAVFDYVKGLSPGELDTLIATIEGAIEDADDDGDVDLDEPSTSAKKGAKSGDSDDDEPVGYSRLDVGTQRAVGAVHSHMVQQAIVEALDSDEELAYNMKQASTKTRDSVKSIVADRLQRLADERGDRFDYNWGATAKQAVAAEKARLMPFFERPARPGMGPGSQSDFQVNRELKVPERVPAFADDRDRDEYLMARMRYNQALIEREQSNVPGA